MLLITRSGFRLRSRRFGRDVCCQSSGRAGSMECNSAGKVIDEKTGKAIPTTFVAYPKDRNGKDDVALYDDVSRFVALNKYIDGSRETVSDMGGNRDGILARLGETYLIAAEVLIRQGEYGDALHYINELHQACCLQEQGKIVRHIVTVVHHIMKMP